MSLAVKLSRHPPAVWCHERAQPGKLVKVRPGGSFSFDPAVEGRGLKNLVLVAGGIGINPLYSILQEALHHQHRLPSLQRVSLLYSVSVFAELAFRAQLLQLATSEPRLSLDFRTTREDPEAPGKQGRITAEDVAALIPRDPAEDPNGSLVYVCGPPKMTDGLVEGLGPGPTGLGIPAQLKYEKWW